MQRGNFSSDSEEKRRAVAAKDLSGADGAAPSSHAETAAGIEEPTFLRQERKGRHGSD